MPSTTETIAVARPAETVLEELADFSRLSEWDPMFDESERLDADGAVRVGSRFRAAGSVAGASFELTMELVVYEPGRRVVLTGQGDGLTTREDISVAPTDEGCEVTYDSSFETDKPAIVEALTDPAFTVAGKRTMSSMRSWLEG
jgi:carbon monoxide dehydrogenase subunit G